MGRRRVLGLGDANIYHVVSRVVDRRLIFGDREKRVFRDILKRLSEFCGVECLTFCLMGNHFHLLVSVHDGEKAVFRESVLAGELDGEMCRRIGRLHGRDVACALAVELRGFREGGENDAAWMALEPFVNRMNDLATFVKELKWRFSAWYNAANGRVGTLWEGRYRSVLVEGSEEALAAVAAYIDLNPVRAGLTKDPKDYRYCGYAEAQGGDRSARRGLRRIVGQDDDAVSEPEVLGRYRLLLFGRSGRTGASGAGRGHAGGEVSADAIGAVESAGGVPSRHELLRGRVRYLTEGAAIGSHEFLERLFDGRREFFPPNRTVPGRRMRGGGWGELFALREVGAPS